MSDGAYRDDQEAALARAAALERELAEARAENAALRARRVEPEARTPRARANRDNEKLPWFGKAMLVAIFLAGGTGIAYTLLWKKPRFPRRVREVSAWGALREVPGCLARGLEDVGIAAVDPAAQDPRMRDRKAARMPWRVYCDLEIDALVEMPAFSAEVPDLLRWKAAAVANDAAVTALDDYNTHNDWLADSYASGPAKWRALQVAAVEEHTAARLIRDRVLPIIESELRRFQRVHEERDGKDATWWRMELGYQYQVAYDDLVRGEPGKAAAEDAAIDAATAPAEVQREVRERHALTLMTFKNELLRGFTP